MEVILCLGFLILIVLIIDYWKIIIPIVLIGLAVLMIGSLINEKIDKMNAEDFKEKVENSDEFKKSVVNANVIKSFFLKNWQEPIAFVSLYRKPYDYITSEDYSAFKFDSFAYIHIKMDTDLQYLNWIREYAEATGDKKRDMEPVILSFFDIKSFSEIPEGLNVDSLIWEVLNGTITEGYNECEVEFSVPILCPCNLKGENRKIFTEKI